MYIWDYILLEKICQVYQVKYIIQNLPAAMLRPWSIENYLKAAETSEKIKRYLPRQVDNEHVMNRMISHIDFIKLDLYVSVEDSAPNRLKHTFNDGC